MGIIERSKFILFFERLLLIEFVDKISWILIYAREPVD